MSSNSLKNLIRPSDSLLEYLGKGAIGRLNILRASSTLVLLEVEDELLYLRLESRLSSTKQLPNLSSYSWLVLSSKKVNFSSFSSSHSSYLRVNICSLRSLRDACNFSNEIFKFSSFDSSSKAKDDNELNFSVTVFRKKLRWLTNLRTSEDIIRKFELTIFKNQILSQVNQTNAPI